MPEPNEIEALRQSGRHRRDRRFLPKKRVLRLMLFELAAMLLLVGALIILDVLGIVDIP